MHAGCTCRYSPSDQANKFSCDNANLNTLPKSIPSNTDWVLFAKNTFKNVQNVGSCFESVTHIEMRSNRIRFISDKAMMDLLRNTTHLDIRNNNLKYLPEFITKSDLSTKLWLSRNPYKCDCEMMWMREWLVGQNNVQDKEDMICIQGKMKGILHFCTI